MQLLTVCFVSALAFATLACIPLRLPVDIGSDEVNLLRVAIRNECASSQLGTSKKKRGK